jgi:hypothetical protein
MRISIKQTITRGTAISIGDVLRLCSVAAAATLDIVVNLSSILL